MSPAEARCYRFVYPHLLVASEPSRQAFIWDIRTSTLIETIDIRLPPQRGGVYRRGSTAGGGDLLFSIDLSEMINPDPSRKLIGNIPCSIISGNIQFP
ncbi:hypothetical protein FRC04_006760 [Tulasnella sp. 424]|nr:hypothetical protein FRC04_006760 [Tulasnella sp. 424]